MSNESLSEFRDRVSYTILKAPDRFPADAGMNLDKAFSLLNAELNEAKAEVGSLFSEISSCLGNAHKAYLSEEIKLGIQSLQKIDNLLRSSLGAS